LFAGVVLHELGHSVVAMRYGVSIDAITLWVFGGIAQLDDQPESWRPELFIAIAGPVVSVALGAIGYGVLLGLPVDSYHLRFLTAYLGFMNLVLAAFNLLPGFPMDGGRVLRALLARTRPWARATQIAAEVGKGFAVLLGLGGLFTGNLLLVGIAFFIFVGAAGEAQRTVMNAAFQGVTVREVMTTAADLDAVGPDLSIADLVDRMFRERHTGYPVVDNGDLVGLVTLEDARQVDPVERDAFRVSDVMTTDVETIDADDDAMAAFERMQRHDVGRLPVTGPDGDLAGLVSRTDLMTAMEIIRESGSTGTDTARESRSLPRGR
ncbi:MAG: CBS domain-containing protein, partial [Halobacteriaceae archaeon]